MSGGGGRGGFVRGGLGRARGALLLSFKLPIEQAELFMKVSEGRVEGEVRTNTISERLRNLIKKVFALHGVVRNSRLCGVGCELQHKGVKALLVLHSEVSVHGTGLRLLMGVVVSVLKGLQHVLHSGVLIFKVACLN